MKNVKIELEQAFRLVSAIPVCGDAVDIMAEAREHIRAAYHTVCQPPDTACPSADEPETERNKK